MLCTPNPPTGNVALQQLKQMEAEDSTAMNKSEITAAANKRKAEKNAVDPFEEEKKKLAEEKKKREEEEAKKKVMYCVVLPFCAFVSPPTHACVVMWLVQAESRAKLAAKAALFK